MMSHASCRRPARSSASSSRRAVSTRKRSATSSAPSERSTEQDVRARVEITRAYVEAETGDPAGAAARCRAVLDGGGLDLLTEGKAWQQLGLILMRTGETDAAMEVLARGDQCPAGDEQRPRLCLASTGATCICSTAGPARQPLTSKRPRSASTIRGTGWSVPRPSTTSAMPDCSRGDLVGALQMIDEAAQVLAPLSRRSTGPPWSRTGPRSSPPPDALTRRRGRCETAAAAYGSRRLRTYQAECELALAWTLLRHDPARARVVARRSARHFGDQASPARALRADTAAVVAEIAAGGRSPALLRRVDDLSTDLRAHGLAHDAAVLELQGARVGVARGDLDAAGERLRRVHVDGSSPVTTRLLSREVRAELAVARRQRRDRPGSTSVQAWPTCTSGSRPSAASTCRARWSGTAATWQRWGSGWRSTAATRWSRSSGRSAPGPWRRG